jgi:hypothetical protein
MLLLNHETSGSVRDVRSDLLSDFQLLEDSAPAS